MDTNLVNSNSMDSSIKKTCMYRCPLSKKIYYDPVIAEDGFMYERNEIRKWLHYKNISPTTGKLIGNRLQRAKKIRLLVEEYLKDNPELKDAQYFYRVLYNRDEVIEYICKEEFERLYDYEDYWLNDMVDLNGETTLIKFLTERCKDSEVIKYVISRSVDYDTANLDGTKPITTIIANCDTKIIKYVVENMDIDLEEADGNGLYPIHTMVAEKGNNVDFINYLVDMKFNLEIEDMAKNKPIHYLAKYGSVEALVAIVDKVNWEVVNTRGYKPLHLVCKSYDINKIDKVLNFSLDFKSEVEDGSNRTCLDILYQNKYLSKENKIDLIYKYLNRVKKTANVDLNWLTNI